MRRWTRPLAGLALVSFTACMADQTTLAPDGTAEVRGVASLVDGGPNFVPGEVLVKFKRGAAPELRGRAMQVAAAEAKERILTAAMRSAGDDEGVMLLRTGMAVPRAIEALLASGAVEYAEPNWVYYHDAISNDTYVTSATASLQLWGMYSSTALAGGKANEFGSGATSAWAKDKFDCSEVWVGIIDEGYMYTHGDLASNAGQNPGEIAGNKRDDDGNGFVDDVFGWDFAGNNNTVFDGVGDDHGSHVAGTIGGVGSNGTGVAGVCWKVKLLNAKFLGATSGTTANAIKAVDYFTDLKNRGVKIVATNNSWGGGYFSQGLKDAISRADGADILFIAAAGNSAQDNDIIASYPSSYDNVNIIAVASIDSVGGMSDFSSYGASKVDLGAPGSAIISTVPVNGRKGATSGYARYSGTSMATPHVTGAVALYKSMNPSASAASIKSAILSAALPTPSLNGKVASNGRLNIAGLLPTP